MKRKGLYVIFAVAALVAINGFIYFGLPIDQQASVGELIPKRLSTKTDLEIKPITTSPSDEGWTKLCKDKKPHIQVLSPNGGEIYQGGQQIDVKWRSCFLSRHPGGTGDDTARITLTSSRPGISVNVLIPHISEGPHSAMVTLPANFPPYVSGTFYKMQVDYIDNLPSSPTGGQLLATDNSNNPFTINADRLTTSLVSSNNTTTRDTKGNVSRAEISMDVRVTAGVSDVFIPRFVKIGTSVSDSAIGNAGFVIVPLNASFAFDSRASVTSTVSVISGAVIDPSGRMRVNAGQSANFRVIASITAPVGSGQKAIQLNAIGASTTANRALVSYPTLPAASYRSGFTPAF